MASDTGIRVATVREQRPGPDKMIYLKRMADFDRLISICSDKLAGNPTNVRALMIRASSYMKKEKYKESVADYNGVLDRNPEDIDARYYRGVVYETMGNLEGAIADFTTVLRLDPNHVKASYARGACQNVKGDFAEAIKDYTHALERDQQTGKRRGGDRGRHAGSFSACPSDELDLAHLTESPGSPTADDDAVAARPASPRAYGAALHARGRSERPQNEDARIAAGQRDRVPRLAPRGAAPHSSAQDPGPSGTGRRAPGVGPSKDRPLASGQEANRQGGAATSSGRTGAGPRPAGRPDAHPRAGEVGPPGCSRPHAPAYEAYEANRVDGHPHGQQRGAGTAKQAERQPPRARSRGGRAAGTGAEARDAPVQRTSPYHSSLSFAALHARAGPPAAEGPAAGALSVRYRGTAGPAAAEPGEAEATRAAAPAPEEPLAAWDLPQATRRRGEHGDAAQERMASRTEAAPMAERPSSARELHSSGAREAGAPRGAAPHDLRADSGSGAARDAPAGPGLREGEGVRPAQAGGRPTDAGSARAAVPHGAMPAAGTQRDGSQRRRGLSGPGSAAVDELARGLSGHGAQHGDIGARAVSPPTPAGPDGSDAGPQARCEQALRRGSSDGSEDGRAQRSCESDTPGACAARSEHRHQPGGRSRAAADDARTVAQPPPAADSCAFMPGSGSTGGPGREAHTQPQGEPGHGAAPAGGRRPRDRAADEGSSSTHGRVAACDAAHERARESVRYSGPQGREHTALAPAARSGQHSQAHDRPLHQSASAAAVAGAPPVAQAATRRPDQRDLHAGSGAARMGQARVQNEMSSSAGPVDAQAPHAQQRGEDAGGPARQVMQEPAGVPHLKWERAGDAHSAAAATGKPAPTSDRSRSERRADVHHARGYALRKKGDFRRAIEEYTQALALCPGHFKARFNRGFSYDKVSEFDLALADYSAAIEVEPENSYAHYNRGITRDRVADYAGAVSDFSTAITLEPANADFYHNRGFSLRKQGRFEDAVADYTAAIDLNPGHCRAYYNRAYSHDRLGACEAAVSDYTRALDLEPHNATAFHNRGSLHDRLGDTSAALTDFGRAIELDPQGPLSYNARGLLLEREGRLADALADYALASTLRPDQPTFLRNHGLCLRACGEYGASVADLTRVLEMEPSDLTALSNRAYSLRKLGRVEEAASDYCAAIQVGPASARLYSNRAYCVAKLGQYAAAVQDYDCVLQLDPCNTHALHNRRGLSACPENSTFYLWGISYDKMGQFDEAVRDFSHVLELEPQNVNAFFNRGSAYDSLGKFQLAVSDYMHALDLDTKNETSAADC